MVRVTVLGDRAVFEVEGLDKLWALKSRLDIPLAHIRDVVVDPDQVGRWWHGLKVWGTEIPGLFAAGTFHYHGELVCWDVRDPGAHGNRVAGARTVQEADYRSRRSVVSGRAADWNQQPEVVATSSHRRPE